MIEKEKPGRVFFGLKELGLFLSSFYSLIKIYFLRGDSIIFLVYNRTLRLLGTISTGLLAGGDEKEIIQGLKAYYIIAVLVYLTYQVFLYLPETNQSFTIENPGLNRLSQFTIPSQLFINTPVFRVSMLKIVTESQVAKMRIAWNVSNSINLGLTVLLRQYNMYSLVLDLTISMVLDIIYLIAIFPFYRDTYVKFLFGPSLMNITSLGKMLLRKITPRLNVFLQKILVGKWLSNPSFNESLKMTYSLCSEVTGDIEREFFMAIGRISVLVKKHDEARIARNIFKENFITSNAFYWVKTAIFLGNAFYCSAENLSIVPMMLLVCIGEAILIVLNCFPPGKGHFALPGSLLISMCFFIETQHITLQNFFFLVFFITLGNYILNERSIKDQKRPFWFFGGLIWT